MGDLSITKDLDKSTKNKNNDEKKKINYAIVINKYSGDENNMNKKNENNNNLIKIKSINSSETNNSKKDYDNEDDCINSEINNEIKQNEYFNINSQKKCILFPEVFPLNKNEKSIYNKNFITIFQIL